MARFSYATAVVDDSQHDPRDVSYPVKDVYHTDETRKFIKEYDD